MTRAERRRADRARLKREKALQQAFKIPPRCELLTGLPGVSPPEHVGKLLRHSQNGIEVLTPAQVAKVLLVYPDMRPMLMELQNV